MTLMRLIAIKYFNRLTALVGTHDRHRHRHIQAIHSVKIVQQGLGFWPTSISVETSNYSSKTRERPLRSIYLWTYCISIAFVQDNGENGHKEAYVFPGK